MFSRLTGHWKVSDESKMSATLLTCNPLDAMHPDDPLLDEMETYHPSEAWNDADWETPLSQMNDILILSLNSPSMKSSSGPDVTERTKVGRGAGQPKSLNPSQIVLDPSLSDGYELQDGAHWIPPT